MAEIGDDDLVRLYCDGGPSSQEAFDVLFDRHHVAVYNLARLILSDAGWAQDVLQDTFLAAAEGLRRYQPRGTFRAWLLRIARNRCLNRLALERRRRAALAAAGLAAPEPADPSPGPAERTEASDTARRLLAAITQLNDRQRQAIALYALEHMTYQEIADAMDSPVNTVKTLIRRARATLAQRLGPPNSE